MRSPIAQMTPIPRCPYGSSINFGSKAMVSGLRHMLGFAWLHRMSSFGGPGAP